jgi:hypothetical protein
MTEEMDERSAGRNHETGCHDGPRGLSASQPWMRADSHDGPELRLHNETEYIDAALTFVGLPESSCDARLHHTWWHF